MKHAKIVHHASLIFTNMPKLSQYMIRIALLWLGLGYTLGGLMLSNKGIPWLPSLWILRSMHVHILLIGWTVQFACGVAFWILPRLDASGSRGDERPVWLCFSLLNAGVLTALVYAVLQMLHIDMLWLQALAGVLYACAALAFTRNAWPRVLPFRTIPRP